MMYPFLTLDDQTEIVHSKLLEDGSVKVYIEKPNAKDGFHYATCFLPEYRWEDVSGFSETEIQKYQGKEPVIKYGVPGRGIEGETLVVNSLPFIDYMDGFPDEKNGLWGVVQELLGRKVDIPDLREKYKKVERVIVREEAEQHTF